MAPFIEGASIEAMQVNIEIDERSKDLRDLNSRFVSVTDELRSIKNSISNVLKSEEYKEKPYLEKTDYTKKIKVIGSEIIQSRDTASQQQFGYSFALSHLYRLIKFNNLKEGDKRFDKNLNLLISQVDTVRNFLQESHFNNESNTEEKALIKSYCKELEGPNRNTHVSSFIGISAPYLQKKIKEATLDLGIIYGEVYFFNGEYKPIFVNILNKNSGEYKNETDIKEIVKFILKLK